MNHSTFNLYLSYWGDVRTWQKIYQCQPIFIGEHMPYSTFQKGVLNRIQILSSQGLHTLSIPIQGGRKNKQLFKDIKIERDIPWQKNHYRSIMSCYGKSPWWKEYEEEIYNIYERKNIFLLDWNMSIYEWVGNVLECELTYTNTYNEKNMPTSTINIAPYQQVFGNVFYEEVFILDAILCMGEKQLKYELKKGSY